MTYLAHLVDAWCHILVAWLVYDLFWLWIGRLWRNDGASEETFLRTRALGLYLPIGFVYAFVLLLIKQLGYLTFEQFVVLGEVLERGQYRPPLRLQPEGRRRGWHAKLVLKLTTLTTQLLAYFQCVRWPCQPVPPKR